MKFWKIIFWLLAILTFFDFIGIPFSETIDPEELVITVVSAMLLIPYYGYAYQVVIGWKMLWITVFIITLPISLYQIWGAIELIVTFIADSSLVSSIIMLITLLFAVALLIPPFFYAFKSNELWEENA